MISTNQTTLSAASDIRDIKPPIEISDGLAWLWCGLTALAVAVAAWLLWRWWQNRRSNVVLPPPIPEWFGIQTRAHSDEWLLMRVAPDEWIGTKNRPCAGLWDTNCFSDAEVAALPGLTRIPS